MIANIIKLPEVVPTVSAVGGAVVTATAVVVDVDDAADVAFDETVEESSSGSVLYSFSSCTAAHEQLVQVQKYMFDC